MGACRAIRSCPTDGIAVKARKPIKQALRCCIIILGECILRIQNSAKIRNTLQTRNVSAQFFPDTDAKDCKADMIFYVFVALLSYLGKFEPTHCFFVEFLLDLGQTLA